MKRLRDQQGANNPTMMVDNNAVGHRCYECKTCGKKFHTFQALGGHQGCHKKVRTINDDDVCSLTLSLQIGTPTSHIKHQCKMCPKKFDTGQALGGHMRQHTVEKDLILMDDREVLRLPSAAGESLVLAAVELRQKKAEEEREHLVKRELVLAGKELRFGI